MKEILENWDIKFNDIVEVQNNIWSIDHAYFLKANHNMNWLSNLQIYKSLRELGIPAPELISTIEGKDYLTYDGVHYFLTRRLEGEHLQKEDIIEDETKARILGKVIAKLHKAFATITNQYEFTDNSLVQELNGWIKDNLLKYASDGFTYDIFEDCMGELEPIYDKLQRHLIHRDMHLGNLLFIDHQVSGYIDFDLTQINARIFDIAYLLAGWLVEKTHDIDYMEGWKKTVHYLIEGYQEEQALSKLEISSLSIMMCCVEMLFVAYWYSIGDSINALKSEECLKWLWNNQDFSFV